jgi:hypothetical protein
MTRHQKRQPGDEPREASVATERGRLKSPDEQRQLALGEQKAAREAHEHGREIDGWKDSRDRISRLRDTLSEDFVNRVEAIHGLLAAIISRAGCVLLGPPGTAKSLLVRRIAERCDLRIGTDDANYFEYLLTAHTMPEELFGPTDIGLLLQQPPVVQRQTVARLPYAELAFLDEVFRGGSHIQNTLLTILNERKFHNGRTVEDVPLVSVIGAANLPPQGEETKAFFDRFPVRIWVDSVLGVSGSECVGRGIRLIQSDARAVSKSGNDATNRPSMLDFRKLWSVLRLKLSGEMRAAGGGGMSSRIQEFTNNFKRYQTAGQLSDRSYVQLWYFAGALDMIAGREPDCPFALGGTGHFTCFRYVAPALQALAAIKHSLDTQVQRLNAAGA